jgi:hypothetical protein
MTQFATPDDPDDIKWPEPEEASGKTDEALSAFPPADVGFVPDAPPVAPGGAEDRAVGRRTTETPQVQSPPLAPAEVAQAEDIETVAARRALAQARKGRFAWPFSWLPTTVAGLLILNIALVFWRAEVVRLAPQTAPLYAAIGLPVNLRGLVLADVTAETQTKDGVQVLLVQGQIVSAARHTVEVPRLRFAVRNTNGNEIYSWTVLPSRSLLSPDESLAFQSRLAAPPPETRDVVVRFFNRHDLAASTQ